MPQTAPIGVRIEVATKRALDRAARADFRSTASLINKILAEYVVMNGLHLDNGDEPAPIYRRTRGRPKAMPDASSEYLDNQVRSELAANMEYTLDEASVAATGKPVGENVAHFGKALERSLLRSDWYEVENVVSGRCVWLSKERFEALSL